MPQAHHAYQGTHHLRRNGPETVEQFNGGDALSAKVGKPLFVGEFPVRTPAQAAEYIRALAENHVPLAAFWTFDNSRQEKTMNVTFKNERSFVIDQIAKANSALQKAP